MSAALSFGVAFGSLVVIRALFDGGSAGIAVTVIMFLFFASISAIAYFAFALLRRGPLVTAMLTALLLLVMITVPGLFAASLSRVAAVRIGLRIVFAWSYVCLLFAGLHRIIRMK